MTQTMSQYSVRKAILLTSLVLSSLDSLEQLTLKQVSNRIASRHSKFSQVFTASSCVDVDDLS